MAIDPHSDPKFSTLCVHGGETLDPQGGIHTPLYNHSTFGFRSTEALLDVVEGRKAGNLYTRYGLNTYQQPVGLDRSHPDRVFRDADQPEHGDHRHRRCGGGC
jgi:hypothetical protein